MQYLQVHVGGYSSSWEAFQVDIETRTSNTAVLFVGVCLTVESLRDSLKNSISTRSMILKLLSHFHHPMTSVPIGAAGTSARRGGSEERLEIVSGLCGITGSTSLKRTGRAIAHPASRTRRVRSAPQSRIHLNDMVM